MNDAAIAAVLKLDRQVMDGNLTVRFPILVSTVVFLYFLKPRNNGKYYNLSHWFGE